MHIETAPRPKRRINLTPLIDVVFILLVFFMLASSLADWRSIGLATGTAPADPGQAPAATVVVTTEGGIRYQGTVYASAAAVAAQLRARLTSGEISAVVVQSEEGVRLGAVVTVFDALAGAGIQALALGTD